MYSVKPIENKEVWQNFVDAAAPHTFLHEYAWGEVEADMGKKIFRLGVFRGATGGNSERSTDLVAVCLLSIVRARRGDHILCPHGPIISQSASAEWINILSALRDELVVRGRQERCDFIRMCPLTIDTPEHRAEYKKLGFKDAPIHVYSELSWILDITPSAETLLTNMKKNTRYGIRKAERDGIVVTSSDNPAHIDKFWNVYSATAARQKFVPYSKKYIAAEFAGFNTAGRALWFFADYKGETVSTAMINFTKHSAFYHHGASLQAHGSITPSELLQWRIIEEAQRRGCSTYNFWGVVPDDQVNHPWAGLSNFKKGFGGFAEAYIHAQDYPLSWKYVITYLIETIRRKKRRV
jgi:lipid II:glycine glycyltransferase (peptidoglycan interpeptide bridge formation enzyme)